MKAASFEAVPIHPDESFAVREFVLPALLEEWPWQPVWHFHPEIEISYIMSGSGKRFVGDSIEAYGPGDFILIGSDLPHLWYKTDQSTTAQAIKVHFRRGFLGERFFDAPEMRAIVKMLNDAKSGIIFPMESIGKLEKKIRAIDENNGMDRLMALIDLLHEMSRVKNTRKLASVSYKGTIDIGMSQQVAKCYQYIIANIANTIRAEEVASAVGMSPSSFARHFKQATGKTFVSFLNEVRVVRACKMLVESDKSIGEIAKLNGFSNLSNFNRRFRDYQGMTPRDYRNQHHERALS